MWKELSGAPIRRSDSFREQALIGQVMEWSGSRGIFRPLQAR